MRVHLSSHCRGSTNACTADGDEPGTAGKSVLRRGKYLFLELDRGLIEMHFRFDGQLTWFANVKELYERAMGCRREYTSM